MRRVILVAVLLALTLDVEAKTTRSASAVREFKRQQPCPATGRKSGPCPGYVIDHVVPLCGGGADHPSNMQ